MDVQYRVLFTELTTGVPIAELPCSALKYSHAITAPGSASFTIGLHQWDSQIRLADMLTPLRAGLYVTRNGWPEWGGILSTWSADLSEETISLDCQGMWEYAKGLVLQEDRDYQSVDQANIVTGLLNDVQTFYGLAPDRVQNGTLIHGHQILNWQHRISPTGRVRDRNTYAGYEVKDLDTILGQLAAVIDGFDLRMEYEWFQHNDPARPDLTGNWAIKNHVRLLYPIAGYPTNIVLQHGVNCEIGTVHGDGTQMGTRGVATGSGDGPDMLIARSTNAAMERDYPPYVLTASYSDVSEQTTLQDKADTLTASGAEPIVLPEITLHPGAYPALGQFGLGDVVDVEIAVGALALSGAYKITQIDVELAEPSNEIVKVTVSPSSLPLSALPPSLADDRKDVQRRLASLERSR